MKKIFILDDYDYLINTEKKGDNVVYKLKSSNSDKWTSTSRNEDLISILDSGNGLILKSNFIKNLILSYSDAVELYLILGQIKGLGTDNIIVK